MPKNTTKIVIRPATSPATRDTTQPLNTARMSVPQPILGNAASRSAWWDPLGASKGNAGEQGRATGHRATTWVVGCSH